jgi:uncharacterized protein (UPF0147 family)
MDKVKEVAVFIESLCKDSSISKNVRNTLEEIRNTLQNNDGKELIVKIDAALQEIESLSLDPNISSYTRTQIWNLTSMLGAVDE